MKGNNELKLNEATMMDAMQEWIDKRMGEYAPEIKAVLYRDMEFIILTKGREDKQDDLL